MGEAEVPGMDHKVGRGLLPVEVAGYVRRMIGLKLRGPEGLGVRVIVRGIFHPRVNVHGIRSQNIR
jgi:hypothetical protein